MEITPQNQNPPADPRTSTPPPKLNPHHHIPTWAGLLIITTILIALATGIIMYGKDGTYIYGNCYATRCLTEEEHRQFAQIHEEFASWKIYRNEEYGFEVKYPSSIRVGDMSENSELGSVQEPVRGIFVGSAIFIVLDTPELKKKGEAHFKAMSPACTPLEIPNVNASIKVQTVENCGSADGGPFFYGLITKGDREIFIDGYSGGFEGREFSDSEMQGRVHVPQQFDQILRTFKFIEPNTVIDLNWKADTSKAFINLSDWEIDEDFKLSDDQGHGPDLPYCGEHAQDPKNKVFRMSKVFNERPIFGDVEAELERIGNAQQKLETDAKAVLKNEKWNLCEPTKDGEVGYGPLGFYKDYLYYKNGHTLLLKTGTRDAVIGGMYVIIQFEY